MTGQRLSRAVLAAGAAVLLAGCSVFNALPFVGGAEKPKPAELQPNPELIGVRCGQ